MSTLRIVVRRRDGQVLTGYTTAFNPSDGSVMVHVAPNSPVGVLVALEQIEVLAMEPTDGRPLSLPPSKRPPSPGVHLQLSNGPLYGEQAVAVQGLGVWFRPPQDMFGLVLIPQGAIESAKLLAEPLEPPFGMWSFLNDANPTDEVELPEPSRSAITDRIEVPTGPTAITKAFNPFES